MYIPIVQHQKKFEDDLPMGKQLFGLKSGSHQGPGSGFQCSQYKNTPSEGVRSKQEKLHNFGPRRSQDLIFGAK